MKQKIICRHSQKRCQILIKNKLKQINYKWNALIMNVFQTINIEHTFIHKTIAIIINIKVNKICNLLSIKNTKRYRSIIINMNQIKNHQCNQCKII